MDLWVVAKARTSTLSSKSMTAILISAGRDCQEAMVVLDGYDGERSCCGVGE